MLTIAARENNLTPKEIRELYKSGERRYGGWEVIDETPTNWEDARYLMREYQFAYGDTHTVRILTLSKI